MLPSKPSAIIKTSTKTSTKAIAKAIVKAIAKTIFHPTNRYEVIIIVRYRNRTKDNRSPVRRAGDGLFPLILQAV